MARTFLHLFPRVRIISLAERTDRRREIAAEIAGIGAGIDGRHVAFHDAWRPDDAGGFPSVGAHGCFLSHLDVLRQALSENAEAILILEDDAHFGRAFRAHGAAVTAALPHSGWDIFHAGHRIEGGDPKTGPLAQVPHQTNILLAHAIAFRRPAIAAAVPYLEAMLGRPTGAPEGGPMHVDGAYSWLRRAHPDLRCVAAVPQIVTQRASRSDIATSHPLRQRLPFIGLVRRIRNALS